eukprot:CAMPEP_0172188756 /NCGR_PEP_ID=MMETSP1050-20130122/22131_1 /TAXON_ID=233186 /ORGANISM="Cryptomonas curvata, Strain CCAP979/52" /LENGTH=120 /DNA_ID=CAMNT_0012863347 /DNA_START=1532 /DNA_END=1894 /DNA_ORIENTATION=+
MGAHQPGAATSIEVTGQSEQSKLLTVGEHRPGGPTIAEPDDSRPAATARSRTRRPWRRRRRSLDSGCRLSLIWPALMADISGTVQGTRYVTRGEMPFPNECPLYGNRCELAMESAVTGRE